jgi:hypothetical protein
MFFYDMRINVRASKKGENDRTETGDDDTVLLSQSRIAD